MLLYFVNFFWFFFFFFFLVFCLFSSFITSFHATTCWGKSQVDRVEETNNAGHIGLPMTGEDDPVPRSRVCENFCQIL